jgi:hypothetical protein
MDVATRPAKSTRSCGKRPHASLSTTLAPHRAQKETRRPCHILLI